MHNKYLLVNLGNTQGVNKMNNTFNKKEFTKFKKNISTMSDFELDTLIIKMVDEYEKCYPNKKDRLFDSYEATLTSLIWEDGKEVVLRAIYQLNRGILSNTKFNSLIQIINDMLEDEWSHQSDMVSAYAESQAY